MVEFNIVLQKLYRGEMLKGIIIQMVWSLYTCTTKAVVLLVSVLGTGPIVKGQMCNVTS